MTYLTIPIQVTTIQQARTDIQKAIASGAEMLELRLDYLQVPDIKAVTEIVKFTKGLDIPLIATCRPTWEGGHFSGEEAQRIGLLECAAVTGSDYIDIELEAIRRYEKGTGRFSSCINFQNAKMIISNHDFKQLPADLPGRIMAIKNHHADIHKIAYMPQTISQSFPALDILHENPGSIAMAMGETGEITRLLAKKLEGLLTFASPDDAEGTAPGQISISQMKQTYRWDKIDSDTRLFGVVGCPVGHSMSPAIHNAAFDAIDFNGLYLPLLVADSGDEFNAFIDGLRQRPWLDFRGFSVTIPHKHNAIDAIKANNGTLEPLAEKIGAVNTILIDENNHLSGYNTDYAGAMDAITETMAIDRSDLKGVPVAIVGAGGVSRALVAGLTDAGAKVTIYNRTAAKAKKLADEFNCCAKPLDELKNLDARLLINCTSIGMYPNINASPIPHNILKKEMAVFDTVYNPAQTRLLKEAQQAGAKTINGVTMFVNQAALQFQMFTNQTPPKDIMAKTVTRHLNP